jgi:TRAP-type transport system large permease protein
VYSLFVGVVIYRELTFDGLHKVLIQTVKDNGMILFIIACSAIFGYVITYNRFPQTMAAFISGVTSNPTLLLMVIMSFLFVAGMFMEATANTLILTPIFLPIVQSAGVDPVHFGICMMTMITMGGMTPPVGVAMYTTCQLMGAKTEDYVKESIPFIIAVVIEVVCLVAFPQISLWLPKHLM